MLKHRFVLAALAGLALIAPAQAEDWRSQYQELTFGFAPSENTKDALNRWNPFAEHLSDVLGVPVKMRVTQDYSAVIEGLRSGTVEIANLGGAGYARARITGVDAEIFATSVDKNNSSGYYSVFFVMDDSPYKTIDDLKGKNLGLVDPNSTSGNNVPRFTLNELDIKPASFFDNVIYTGSHENSLLALTQGTVDVAANAWASEDDSVLHRMLSKGILKHDDGTDYNKDEFRMILKSDIIPGGAYATIGSLPEQMKKDIAQAFYEAASKNKPAVDRLWDGAQIGFVPRTNEDYASIVKLVRFVDDLRKKN